MKIGDNVRVIGMPECLPDDDMGTGRIFELCLGKTFPIKDLQSVEGLDYKMVELHVGEVVGEPDYAHMIWIEPEFVELV